jgi:arylsulfatase A-like enzyme
MKRFLLPLLLIACLMSCSPAGQDIGVTYLSETAEEVKLGDTIVAAESKHESFLFTPPSPGAFRFIIGNPNNQTIQVNAASEQITLEPRIWRTFNLDVPKEGVEIQLDQGPILWGPTYRQPSRQKQKNIMLVSIDTLRHDAFSPQLMPQLYKLFSEKGMIFTHAYSPSPWTLPGHASMLTGELPAKHGIRTPSQKLADKWTTLPEYLAMSGYYNLAVTEGNYVSAQFGFAQGFHLYTERPPNMMLRDPDALSKLAGNLKVMHEHIQAIEGEAPVFAFFHTYEVHCPYLPHDGLRDPEQIGMTQWLLDNEGKEISESQMELLRRLYNSEVRYTDRVMGPYIKELIDSGEWLVILTSDHGEEFGEHGGILHADTLYDEVMRVPLAIAGGGDAGKVIDHRVSILDIVPTLLQYVEKDGTPPDHLPGRDLLGEIVDDATFFAESYFLGPHIPGGDPRIGAVWNGSDKLIQTRIDSIYTAELFDLAKDPAELQNVVEVEIQKRNALYLFLEAYLEKGSTAPAVGELSEEQLEVMRTLGYIK